MESTQVRRFDPYLQVDWLKLLQSDLYSRKFEYIDDSLEMRRGPTGTNRRSLSVATGAGDFVAGRSVGYEKQA